MKEILAQAQAAIAELLSAAVTLKPGDMMVVGCSTSEICGPNDRHRFLPRGCQGQ